MHGETIATGMTGRASLSFRCAQVAGVAVLIFPTGRMRVGVRTQVGFMTHRAAASRLRHSLRPTP